MGARRDLTAPCQEVVCTSTQTDLVTEAESRAFQYRQEKSIRRFHQMLFLPTDSGRRDWTRTNDPHHVKVVL